MEWPSQCVVCGGKLKEKRVQKVLWGGHDSAVIKVSTAVCLKCGEHFYASETVEIFEEIRKKLKAHKVKQYKPIGRTYAVA
jgi:YgiT-type zinc finger domain-containing protein